MSVGDGGVKVLYFNVNSAQGCLYRNLPNRRGADENFIVWIDNNLASRLAEASIVRQPPEQDMSVQKEAHVSGFALEFIQHSRRKRRVEIFPDFDLAAQLTQPPTFGVGRVRNQPSYGFTRLRNDDFLAISSHVDKAGELRLGLVDVHFIHD